MPEHFHQAPTRIPCGSLKCRYGLGAPRPLDQRRARRVFWRPGVRLLRPPQSSWCEVFCNDCGSPVKPCNRCDAVNHPAATNCYKCGAEYPALFTTPEATPVLPAADLTSVWATPGGARVVATLMQPPLAGRLRANRRLAAIAMMLIAGVYAAYRINAATPGAIGVASQPIGVGEHSAPTATSAVPMVVESKPVEPETTAALQAPIPTTNLGAPKRASTRQHPVPARATKRASAHQRPVPELQGPVALTLAAAPVRCARCGNRRSTAARSVGGDA